MLKLRGSTFLVPTSISETMSPEFLWPRWQVCVCVCVCVHMCVCSVLGGRAILERETRMATQRIIEVIRPRPVTVPKQELEERLTAPLQP